MTPTQDLRIGGRQSKAQYQFTLTDSSLSELEEWLPKIITRLQALPELVDVSTDRQQGGLKAKIVIDRNAASRLGVAIQSIDAALNSAFGQRQDLLVYTPRNQYRVVIEVLPQRQRDPGDVLSIYVTNVSGREISVAALAHIERQAMPLLVNHQGVVPAITITYNVAPAATLDAAIATIERTVDSMQLPASLHAGFAGDAADFKKVVAGMAVLILSSLLCVYIILGILYESLIHPITIISTLPSAGLGALLSLEMRGMEFTVTAFIGILLLIGIVKKNGIMLVDFALQAERDRGLSTRSAVLEAARQRFRPIMMTTFAAIFGAIPLAFAGGVGAEIRRPLGITVVGGLMLSQVLTLYTTPVIYVLMSKFQKKFEGYKSASPERLPTS